MAARLLGEAENHAQAQAAALADLLGGEEGLEDVVDILRGYAGAGIGDREPDVMARRYIALCGGVVVIQFDVGGFDGQPAALRHGIAGVHGQVEQRTFQLARVDLGGRQAAGKDL